MRSRLERLIGIEEAISKNRYPDVDTLCRMFNVKPRTIYDDIKLLKERLGLDIVYDRARNGYFNNTPNKRLPAFDLTEDEAFMLVIGSEVLAASLGHALREVLESAMAKVCERLPENVRRQMPEIISRVRTHLRENGSINLQTLLHELTRS